MRTAQGHPLEGCSRNAAAVAAGIGQDAEREGNGKLMKMTKRQAGRRMAASGMLAVALGMTVMLTGCSAGAPSAGGTAPQATDAAGGNGAAGDSAGGAAAGTTIAGEGFVQAAGTIVARTTVNLVPKFSATVVSLEAEEGQRVMKGDPILTLDLADYRQTIQDTEDKLMQSRQQLESSHNTLASAETELARAKAEYEAEKASTADIDLKKTDVSQAEENLKRAQKTVSDDKALLATGAISQAEMDAATQKMEDAQRTLDQKKVTYADAQTTRTETLKKLESSLTQQTSSVENQKISIGILEQQIKTAETDLSDMKDNLAADFLKDAVVVSNLDNAVVQDIVHAAGDSTQAGARAVTLADMNSLTVEADVSEDFIKDVKVGAKVEIVPLFDSGRTYTGTVVSMADMGVSKNSETFVTTRISIDDADEAVRPGFNVDVKIATE